MRSRRGFTTGAWALVGSLAACSHAWDDYAPAGAEASSSSSGIGGGAGGGGTSSGPGEGGSALDGPGGTGGEPAWFDDALSRRRALTLAAPGTSEVLGDFPVLVRLDPDRIDYASTQRGGMDLRFVASDNATLLAHEIETWDADGESFVWVRVPAVGSAVTTIWMYYGGEPSAPAPDPHATWSNGFLAVWHLGADLSDATGHGHDGSGQVADALGMTGLSREFGADDFIDVAASPEIDSLFVAGGTLCAWIRPQSSGQELRGRILDRTLDSNFTGGWAFLMSEYQTVGSIGFAHSFATSVGWWTTPESSITYGEWQNVAVSYSVSMPAPAIYLDGNLQQVVVADTPAGAAPAVTSMPSRIGNRSGGLDRDFAGRIDELRISSTIRSADWISVEVLSARDLLVQVGAEQQH